MKSSSPCTRTIPLCDRIRWLLRNMQVAQAWHKAVLANSPFAYKTFADNFGNSPYAQVALNLQANPKNVPLMQATHLMVPAQLAPYLKPGNFGLPKEGTIKLGDTVAPIQGGKLGIALGDKPKDRQQPSAPWQRSATTGKSRRRQDRDMPRRRRDADGHDRVGSDKKIVTLPAPGATTGNSNGNTGINGGKIVTLPATTVGKALRPGCDQTRSRSPDIKTTTFPAKRIVDAPVNEPQFEVGEDRQRSRSS